MTTQDDMEAFITALRTYEEHMLLAIDVGDVNEYLKIKGEALNKAADVIAHYRETRTGQETL
jgi:hypothetical protein